MLHGPYRRKSNRYAAKKTLLSDVVQNMRENLHTKDYRARVAKLHKSNSMDEVLDKARLAVANAATDLDDSNNPAIDQHSGFFRQIPSNDKEEEDLKDNPDQSVERVVDEEVDGATNYAKIAYNIILRIFIIIIIILFLILFFRINLFKKEIYFKVFFLYT
jgi:hypothetical protein